MEAGKVYAILLPAALPGLPFHFGCYSQWRWADAGGKPRSVAACQYIELGLTDVERKLSASKSSKSSRSIMVVLPPLR